MPIVTQVICDRCQRVKAASNGWWAFARHPDGDQCGFILMPLDYVKNSRPRRLEDKGTTILCGAGCVAQEISERLGSLGVTTTPSAP